MTALLHKLLLLHGALDTKAQFEELCSMLEDDFEIYTFNFSGHGGEPMSDSSFSIKLFAEETINFLDKNNIDTVNIAGHSMGGYVGLYLARFFPGRVHKVFTINTKLLWDKDIAANEVKMLDADKIIEKVPEFAKRLEKLHAPNDWKILLEKVSALLTGMGNGDRLNDEDFEKIEKDVLLGAGDNDEMVSIEETLRVFKKLKKGSMLVLPGTQHPFRSISAKRLAFEMRNFF